MPRLSALDLETCVADVTENISPIEKEITLTSKEEFYKMRIIPYRTTENVVDGAVITFVNITEVRIAHKQAEKRSKQQAAIAELGLYAVQNEELMLIFEKAVSLASKTLNTEYVKILELQPGGKSLLLVSGCGWNEGIAGNATVEVRDRSQAGFTLLQDSPVIVKSLPNEKRFSGPKLLTDHKVESGMSVVIYGRDKFFGVLGVHSKNFINFTDEEADFLQSFANILAAAVQRNESSKALRGSQQRLSLAIEAGKMGTWEWNIETGAVIWSDKLYEILGAVRKQSDSFVENFYDYIHPEDLPDLQTKIAETLKKKQDFYHEFRIIRKNDKAVRWLVGQGKMILNDKEPAKMVGVNYDITEKMLIQEKLQIFNEQLEQKVFERTSELKKANTNLQIETEERINLLRQLVSSQENERSRIARDLHDELGQQLTALRLNLESLKNQCLNDAELLKDIKNSQAIAETLDSDVSFLAWKMRPTALDDLGLVTALENYTREWSQRFNIEIDLHVTNINKKRFSAEIETNLYRIAQEALNNVSKHSQADNVVILLKLHREKISLIIEDNGRGFDLEEERENNKRGVGISSMRERADLIGGSFEIETAPGDGTTIYIRVPAISD